MEKEVFVNGNEDSEYGRDSKLKKDLMRGFLHVESKIGIS